MASFGTVRDKHLVYNLAPIEGGHEREYRTPISRLRGDGLGPGQSETGRGNLLRSWENEDVSPKEPKWAPDAAPVVVGSNPGAWIGGDIWLERLYAVQWMSGADLLAGKAHPNNWFAAPRVDDLEREAKVLAYVDEHLREWQTAGLVPNMRIEHGVETARLLRERGWTHWHHLFTPRHLMILAAMARHAAGSTFMALDRCQSLNIASRMNMINSSAGQGGAIKYDHVFMNQRLNTFYNYGVRGSISVVSSGQIKPPRTSIHGRSKIVTRAAGSHDDFCDIWIYDPPYADAVHYHEITEYFIAWLRNNPPRPFDQWTWDSRRPLAFQGKGEKFRADMVAAFHVMADHMPDNGMQVCMFTHKDAAVWADLTAIVWAAGLRVTAAWYVSTETTSELKKGGYVQGTVLLVIRKRCSEERGYRSDIVPEVRCRVATQVETLTGLNQRTKGTGRDENLFSDADIQMAGYAAALEVLTNYTHIDDVNMTREAMRPRERHRRGQPVEIGVVEEMIGLAVQTANEMMVPEGLPDTTWERLGPTERFYLKMTATEAGWPTGATGGKLDDYQNFAKAYRAEGWEGLMADRTPNRARIKSAAELRSAFLQGHAISEGSLRPTLYAVMGLASDIAAEIDAETSGAKALHGLRDHFGDGEWLRARDNVRTLATWLGRTWARRNPSEGSAARVLASLIGSERL